MLIVPVLFSYGQTEKKVLFLGNSYTAYNDLPSMVEQIANSAGNTLIFDQYTPGGYRFSNHLGNQTTLEKIKANEWDYVVLQGQSQETSLGEAQKNEEVYPFARALSDSIKSANECAHPMFYMTWGRKNGDANNCNFLPWVCTYEGMDDAVKESYIFMAQENKTELAPVGAVWRHLRANHPEIELYNNDQSHPSLLGSYAAACAFYTMIFKEDPTATTWNPPMTIENSTAIKMASKAVVFDEIESWNFTVNPAMSDFTESIEEGLVNFTNNSAPFDSLLWDFGDGTSSFEANPSHEYLESGNYNVSLTSFKCGQSDTQVDSINIEIEEVIDMGNDELKHYKPFKVYPNPINDKINIRLDRIYPKVNITIFDITGKARLTKAVRKKSDFTMNVSNLGLGIYTLKVEIDGEIYSRKICKH